MSENTPEVPAPEAPEQGNPDEGTEPLGDAGKKALDAMKAKWKDAEKQAATLQQQIDAINQANESALEKAQREAKEANEAATKASSEALRFRIAAEKGITDNVDLILTASDEETMRKQADLWSTRQTDGATPGPRPDLSQGAKGAPAGTSPEQDFANFLGAQMSGRG